MTYSSFWYSNTSTPLPPGPIDIGNSLRFNGAQYLDSVSTTTIDTDWTFSGWLKLSITPVVSGTNNTFNVFLSSKSGNSGTAGDMFYSSVYKYTGYQTSWNAYDSTATYRSAVAARDDAAWYHVVIQQNKDANTSRWFINGKEVIDLAAKFSRCTSGLSIGKWGAGAGSAGYHFEGGYMADIYLVQQSLPPTAFGKYDDNNKWIPIEYEGNYGSNGFHLTFQPDSITQNSDGTITVADMSGLGNNFIGTGFDIAPPGVWSNYLTVPGGWSSTYPATKAFDGNPSASNYCQSVSSGELVATFAPPTPIKFTKLEVFSPSTAQAGRSASWDGNTVDLVYNDWTIIFDGSGEISSTKPLTFNNPSGAASPPQLSVSGIRINGTTVLVDNNGADYSLMVDSPTQNFATLSSLTGYPSGTSYAPTSNGFLTTTGTSNNPLYLTPATISFDPNDGNSYYWEVNLNSPSMGMPWVFGVAFEDNDLTSYVGTLGSNGRQITLDYGGGITANSPGNAYFYWYPPSDPSGSGAYIGNYGVLYDGSDRSIRFTYNGEPLTFTDGPSSLPQAASAFPTGRIPLPGDYAQYATTNSSFAAASPVTNVFDGSITTYCDAIGLTGQDTTFTFAPTTPIKGITKLEVYKSSSEYSSIYNGVTTSLGTAQDWAEIPLNGASELSTTTPLTIRRDENSASLVIYAFRVNGNILIDGYTGRLTPVYTAQGTGDADSGINFGQRPFLYTPPEGYLTLQTQNLPVLDVTDGMSEFRAVEGPGAGILPIAQGKVNGAYGATGFPTGLWWIKDLDNANQHQLVDVLRGSDKAFLSPGPSNASGPEVVYTPPTGDSIAWCWNSGGNTLSDTSTDNPFTYQVNTDAGFEIQYTTNAGPMVTTSTQPHHLGKAPELIMFKGTSGNYIWTWHKDMSPNTDAYLSINTNAGVTSVPNYTFPTLPTDTEYTPGSLFLDASWSADCHFSTYLWTSIPGYSAFGSYTGNNNVDGPFVYTGFTPAIILIKNTSSGDWSIYDSTTTSFNPADTNLISNTTAAQDTSATNEIDFLSNGFKLRNANNARNGNGTYIYMAFASNPFGGANVEPADGALTRPEIPGVPDLNSDGNSLRFRGTQWLTRAGMTGSNTGTFSFWFKRGEEVSSKKTYALGTFPAQALSVLGNNQTAPQVSNAIQVGSLPGTGSSTYTQATLVDYSAWYNVVFSFKNQALSIYLNGELQSTTISGAGNDYFTGDGTWVIGAGFATAPPNNPWIGYMSDVYFVDDQSLPPTTFGRYDNNGVWVPLTDEESFEKIGGTAGFGANGFYLDMKPSSVQNSSDGTVLEDKSGNGNNFTTVGDFGASDPTSADYDFMTDGPGQNFATLLASAGTGTNIANFIDANLSAVSNTSTYGGAYSSISVPLSGKWYLEKMIGEFTMIGVQLSSSIGTNTTGESQTTGVDPSIVFRGLGNQPGICIDGVLNAGGTLDNDVFGYPNGMNQLCRVMLDLDAATPTLSIEVNGVTASQELSAGLLVPGSNLVFYFGYTAITNNQEVNFGQQPFQYSIPAGYKTLEVDNLPAVTIADGSDAFRALEAPGGGILPVAQGLNNDMYGSTGFTSALWWIKDMENANQWQFLDSVRGTTGSNAAITCPLSNPETSPYTAPVGTSVAYCWNASDPTTYGFNILTWTGDGVDGRTIATGLPTTAEFVIYTNITLADTGKNVYYKGAAPGSGMSLNSTVGEYAFGGGFVTVNGTDLVLNAGSSNNSVVNALDDDYIAYAWTSVPGYSSIGTYEGNSNADGPFIYTGFTPSFVMYKNSTGTSNWQVRDSTRNSYNPADSALYPNTTGAQLTNSSNNVEFLSNGFKIANGDGDQNTTGQTYIYMAFASVPFGGNNVNEAPAALTRPQATPKDQGPLATLSNSLRFRGAQNLTRTFASNTSSTRTVSFWAKKDATNTVLQHVFSLSTAWSVEFDTVAGDLGQPSGIGIYDNSLTHNFGVGSYLDPSAWYHVVATVDGPTAKIWVNGEQILDKQLVGSVGALIAIGSLGNNNYYFDGCMADVNFIDGLAIEPTAFGGYDTNGNWVPRDYNGSYGANGFYLTFAADTIVSSDLSSDWRNQLYTYTPTSGFGDPTPAMLASTEKNFLAGAEPPKGFNGSSQSYTFATMSDAWLFRPNTPMTGVTKIEVWNGTSEVCWVNGVNSNTVGTAFDFTTVYNGPAITLTTLSGLYPTNYTPGANISSGFSILKINGRVLIDNSDTTYQSTTICLDQSGNANNFTMTGFDTEITTPINAYYWDSSAASDAAISAGTLYGQTPTGYVPAAEVAASSWAVDYVTPRITQTYDQGVATSLSGTSIFVSDDGTTWRTGSISGPSGTVLVTATDNTPFRYFKYWVSGSSSTEFDTTGPGDNSNYDLMADGPSTNYATINPLSQGTITSYVQNSNMSWVNPSGDGPGIITTFLPTESGKYYGEVTISQYTPGSTEAGLFIVPGSFTTAEYSWIEGRGIYDSITATPGMVWYQEGSGAQASSNKPSVGVGSVYQIAIDNDAGTVSFGVDNNWLVGATDTDGGTYQSTFGVTTTFDIPFGSNLAVQGSGAYTQNINYGQQPFKYTPPTGYLPIKATNLSAATITNGTEGFRPVIGTGNDVLAVAQGEKKNPDGYTGFPSGLWWIKDIQNANQWQFLDPMRGLSARLSPQSNPNTAAYTPPTGTSISYNWSAPDSWTDGASSGYRNQSTGFSMLKTDAPNNTPVTVPHGLPKAPEFYVFWSEPNPSDIFCWHKDLTTDYYIYLNMAIAQTNNNWAGVIGTQPTATDLSCSSNAATPQPIYCYAWTSIPGYSSFGSYTGNGSADGPYIYTGFKPAFVMVKQSSGGTINWRILDSTRNPYNVANEGLFPNTTSAQNTTFNDIAFMSNGFKLSTSADINAASFDYIYVAFASNPFGGSNVNPTNAALTPVPVVQYDEGDYSVGGTALTVGTAFTHNGIQYPSNWRDILSHEYLTGIGATWTLE